EVPGRDQADDTERASLSEDLPAGNRLLVELAERPVALAAEEPKDCCCTRRLAARLAKRLAHLARHLRRDVLDPGVDDLGDLHDHVAALRRRRARPRREGVLRLPDGILDVAPLAGGGLRPHPLRPPPGP